MENVEPPARRGARKRWLLHPRQRRELLGAIVADAPLLAQLLYNRGVGDAAAAERFLAAHEAPLADPWLLADLPAAVERLERAIRFDELIAIYGDYDVDGLTATAVLYFALTRLGARLLPFIPHRVRDGYGLQEEPLRALRAQGASLIVTVDCGVSATAEIAAASTIGLDVVVTDHHIVPDVLPSAVAVVNPRRHDCAYPFKHLAGVGVAFRLAAALLRRSLGDEAEALLGELSDLVALGTIADVMPLEGENRTHVLRGLARINASPRAGLAALIEVAGLKAGQIAADNVSFGIAPRLNAAGRIDHARVALELLLASDRDTAVARAEQLQRLNRQRQEQTEQALELARASLRDRPLGAGVVIAGPYPVGIVGLVASRLVEELSRPVVALSVDDGLARGSARSVPGVNVVEALAAGAEHMLRFGGHAMAAGCTLPVENVPALAEAFAAAVGRQRGEWFPEPVVEVDAEVYPSTALKLETLDLLDRLEPCGAGNPTPVFLTRNLKLTDCRVVGGGKHLKLRLSSEDGPLTGMVWRTEAPPCELGTYLDVVYHLRRNVWNGRVSAELEVLDWAET